MLVGVPRTSMIRLASCCLTWLPPFLLWLMFGFSWSSAAWESPRLIILVMQQLYNNCLATIRFGSLTTISMLISSGIKQGCPASGSLLALALDPFFRMLVEAVPQPYNMICAFADDIGIVARAIFKVVPIILKLFTNLFLATRLQLNFRKTAVIPLWDNGVSDIRYWAADRAPQLLECNFASCATYLGIVVGPGAEANRWTKASAKF